MGGLYGPSGGTGGGRNTGFQTGFRNVVVQIKVWSDQFVHAIAFLDQNDVNQGALRWIFGNITTAPLTATINLDTGERVIGIVGKCGAYVDSIRIVTLTAAGDTKYYPPAELPPLWWPWGSY